MLFSSPSCLAQTREVPQGAAPTSGGLEPQGAARQTAATAPANPYADAIGQIQSVDQSAKINTAYIKDNVDKIITGEYTNVVFQAAEQGRGADVQKIANNALNAGLGVVNENYRGMHKWFEDDIVRNLFGNIDQVAGKFLTNIIDNWIADTAQYLAQFLKIFVLNPNVAVNGLDGSHDDQISRYVRQGADVMYGIAVDLLLLLFILCIWKNWAEASWRGAGNLMGCIGRLIFTAGLLLAWPTIYAFVVQISNEMIKAVCFSNTQELAMLHVALAAAIKGGLLASAAGVSYILAPIAGGVLGAAPGMFVGSIFKFASLVVFLILGGALIAELVYILILKAIQTALLTAQYMFAPIFLVFFALPDTENVATGYVRAFVETSLWTFVWVGLLKVMVIVMYADYNPWGKVLIAVGVLQLMIQVPTFLARCQISPMSDFVSAGLVTGGVLKVMGGLGGMLEKGLTSGIGLLDKKAGLGFQTSKTFATAGLGGAVASQNDLNSLNEASKKGREYKWDNGGANGATPPSKNTGATGPGAQGQNLAAGLNAKPNAKPNANAVPPPNKPGGQPLNTPGANPAAGPQPAPGASAGASGAAGGSGGNSGGGGGSGSASGAGASGAPAGTAAGTTGTGAAGGPAVGPPPAKPQTPPGAKPDSKPKDEYSWGNTAAEDWEQKGLKNVPARAIVGKITNVDGVGIKHGQKETSIQGSMKNGVERLNVREGASDAELARATYAAGYTDLATQEAGARDAAVRSAVAAKAWKPKGIRQALAANWLESQGKSWADTAWGKQNFEQGVFEAAASGSAAYVSGGKGNAYTDYLKGRYGEWDAEQDAFATHIVSNPESSESPWNRNIGPATQALIRAGVPISMGTRGAMQNMTVQGMHPSRQKKAALALLSYTYDTAKETFGNDVDSPAFALGHGELARSLPADQVNEAMAIYETSGSQSDVKPAYGGYVSRLSGASGQEMPVAYQALAMSAPHVASTMGRLRANVNPASIQTLSDLEANIVAAPNETQTQSFHAVMDAVSTGLAAGEMHGIPMKMVSSANVGRGIIEFMGGDILNTSSPDAHRKMRVISQNLRTVGTPNDVSTYAAIDTVLQNNGPMLAGADQINVARALIDAGCPANVLPGAVSMAITGGFHMQSQPLPINTIVEAAALESSGVAMNSQKVRLVGRLLDGGISRDLMPAALDVAMNGGYAQSGAALPIGEIESIAKQYQTGALSDTRYTPAVAAMINAGAYNINNQNVRIVAEASADLGGYKNSNDNYIRAVLKVSEGLVNPNVAPGVLETYVRASAVSAGVPNALSLPLSDVLNQMPSFDVSQAPNAIRSIQQSGAFSPYQMQDPVAVNMMIDHASSGSYSLRAINVVARLMGSDQASSSPGHIEVAKEFLCNGGEMTKLNTIEALNAARSFADMREHNCTDPAVFTPAVMEHMKINPSIVRACTPDLMNGGNSISQATWDRIVQNAIQRGGGVGP